VEDVKITCDPSEVFRHEISGSRIIYNHLQFVKFLRGRSNQVPSLLTQVRVVGEGLPVDAVDMWLSSHAHVQVCVSEPLHRFVDRGYRPEGNFRIEIVHQMLLQLRLNCMLFGQRRNIMLQLVLGSANESHALTFILRSSRTTENLISITGSSAYLQHIQHPQINKFPLRLIIQLRPLNDNRVRR
jgi:hypothetical protein